MSEIVGMPTPEEVMEAAGVTRDTAIRRLRRYQYGRLTLDGLLSESKNSGQSGNEEWRAQGIRERRERLKDIPGSTRLERREYDGETEMRRGMSAAQTAKLRRRTLADEIVRLAGISRKNAYKRLDRLERGELAPDKLFAQPLERPACDSERLREVMERAGCARSTAQRRMMLRRQGIITEEQLYAPPSHPGRGGRKKL